MFLNFRSLTILFSALLVQPALTESNDDINEFTEAEAICVSAYLSAVKERSGPFLINSFIKDAKEKCEGISKASAICFEGGAKLAPKAVNSLRDIHSIKETCEN